MKLEAIKWSATAVAVSVGILVTHNPDCLWAFLFPALF